MMFNLARCDAEGWLGDVHWALGVILWGVVTGVAGDHVFKAAGEGRMSLLAAIVRAIFFTVATPIGVRISARVVGGSCGYFGGGWLSLGLTFAICGLFLFVRRYERNSNLLRILAHALIVVAGAHALWAMSGAPEAQLSQWTSRPMDPILRAVPMIWLATLGVVVVLEILSRSASPTGVARWTLDALEFVATALGVVAQVVIVDYASIPYAGLRLYLWWPVLLAIFVGAQGRFEWQRRRSSA
jgi:hypothetical protein